MYEKSNLEGYITICKIDNQLGICCMAQEMVGRYGRLFKFLPFAMLNTWMYDLFI